jgi:hypothetical protein
VPERAGFVVYLRLGRGEGDFWTPYYYLGTWGQVPPVTNKIIKDDFGTIDTDYFVSDETFDRVQYHMVLAGLKDRPQPVARRFALVCSNTLGDAELAARFGQTVDPGPADRWQRRLPVPYRSQKVESPELKHRICSPTSTSMVMAYYGVNVPTVEMCELVYDEEYEIYGNWWRAVQGAYTHGVPGHLERFSSLDAVQWHIAEGRPVIASIRVEKGDLPSAPYRQSDGHLLVVTGFDAEGNVHINDPAAETAEQGITTYDREAMEKVWLGRRGVGYVLLPPRRP